MAPFDQTPFKMLASLRPRMSRSHRALRRARASLVLVCASGVIGAAGAGDTEHERVQLAAALRQLDAIERTLAPAARRFPGEPGLQAFDYAAVLADLESARARIRAYLIPPRAHPATPVDLRDGSQPSGDITERDAP